MRDTGRLLGIFLLIAISATAASAEGNGRYGAKLLHTLREVANGKCPSDTMSVMLVDACEQQMPVMKPRLQGLGKINETVYKGDQQFPMGMAEIYRVNAEHGSMTWAVSAGPDGKFVIFWTPG
jgi:hypothetical protein